ncbi:MAG: xanthine dehydrogenase family protein molybdopterin-binding subunit [Clostridiales Family XIII bacterium]|jgi:CO/xanthine dehydrogenase Mo-binding subunit|nr:xanthine dehydrogenase family protein molybdopterin-binding subunit [Clostridiales Family XIII bacterium]
METKYTYINTNVPRTDALEKVTGKAVFTSDVHPDGMLYGRLLGSPIAHGVIKSMDTSAAEALPGVHAVITGKDVPERRYGAVADKHIICKKRVRFVDDTVAAVAATTPEIAEKAVSLIKVEYEELQAVFDVKEAYKSDCAVILHDNVTRYKTEYIPNTVYRFETGHPNVFIHRQIRHGGDIDEAFARADHIYEGEYSVPRVSHTCLEPHVALAKPDINGGMTVWASEQGSMRYRQLISEMFEIEYAKVRLIIPYLGGGFGGKVEISNGPLAVALALKAKRPVLLESSREEAFIHGSPRSPATIYVKDGIMKDGTIAARELFAVINGGGYSAHGVVFVNDGTYGAVGTYKIPNFKLDAMGVYTNTPPTGPYRSLGSEIYAYAIECQMDRAADAFGFDKIEFRRKNLLVDGDIDCCGQETYNNTTVASLDKAAEYIEWGKNNMREEGPWIIGKGIAVANKYTMTGSTSVVRAKLNWDESITLYHFHVEMGQGCNTLHRMVAAEEFGIDPEKVYVMFADSDTCPFDFGTFCSRGTFMNCNATILACQNLKKKILGRAADIMKIDADKLDTKGSRVFATDNPENSIGLYELFDWFGCDPVEGEITAYGVYEYPLGLCDDDTGQGKAVAYYSYGAVGVEAGVNRETGDVRIFKCGTWFDMGTQLNPIMCDIQSESALVMGIGQVCFETELFNEKGKVINANFRDYKVPTMLDVPRKIALGHTGFPHREGPYGAKGAGEVVLAPVLPAVANAINNALGVEINDIPIDRELLFSVVREKTARSR